MAADTVPPNGTSPVSNLQNVEMDTEPIRPAVAVENALSEIQADQEVLIPLKNLNKADQCSATLRNPARFFGDRPEKVDGRSVLCKGFSIREYVAKVRSVDIRKCWPLSESLLDESLREGRNPPLPPLVRPNYRWWSCQQCLGMSGEHTHFGLSVDGRNSICTKAESNSQNFDHIVDQQLMVSLDTDLDVALGISQDEQIRKLCSLQSSGRDLLLNIARSEDAIKIIENKSERVDNCLAEECGRNNIAPSGHSKIEAPKCTTMSDVKASEPERVHKRVKTDRSDVPHAHTKHTVMREFDNRTQIKNSTVDLMEKQGDLLNDIGNCKRKAKAMRVPDEAADQVRVQSVTMESERSKIDILNSETTKIESVRHHNFDIGNMEGSGAKICPVCKTFTSATITAVNAHMDNCLAQVSKTEKRQIRQKQKSRTRKKRSIVDICATAPPVQISLEYLDNFQMYEHTDESDCSHGMDVNSDQGIEGTTNGALKESRNSIQTGSGTPTRDDSSTLKCKRKQPAEAHYFMGSGKATNGDGQGESLEMKRRRQRLGIVTCAVASKDLKVSLKTAKMPSSTTKAHNGVGHHVKDSSKPVKLRGDSNGEQLSNVQLNSEQHFDVARDVEVSKTKSQQQWSGTFREDITPHSTTELSASLLPQDLKALECGITDIVRGRESVKLCAKDSTGKPPSFPAISDGTGNASDLSGVGDTVPSLNEPAHVYTKKPKFLGDDECIHQNEGNIGHCKLQEEESSEQGDQNLPNKRHFKENNKYGEASFINPGKMGGPEELNERHRIGICSKSSLLHSLDEDPLIRPNVSPRHEPAKFTIDFVHQTEKETGQHVHSNHNLGDASNSLCLQSVDRRTTNSKALCLQSVDRRTTNSKALPSFQNETLISANRKVTEGPVKITGLNLNQKVSVIPRDSKGRFISTARMTGGKECELSYSGWKQADRHKPMKRSTNSVNTSALQNETNFSTNAACSYARIGKSTSVKTNVPVCKDSYGGRKSVSRYKSVPELNDAVAGQAAFSSPANTTLNRVEAPLSEKTIDLANLFIQRRCSDYGYIGLPLDSQGELIRYIPKTANGDYDPYRIQNSTYHKEPLVRECSKSLPEFNFVESMDVSNNISEVGRILKTPSDSDSVPRNFKWPSEQNYSIPCKQTDCCDQYLTFKTDQIKPEKVGLVQPSSLVELQRDYVGNSHTITFGSSISKKDTSSTVESGCNGEWNEKSSAMEKTYPEVQRLKKEQPTIQPVMRLMGHSFIIGGEIENEAGNTLKDYQQSSNNATLSTSKATLNVSSQMEFLETTPSACNTAEGVRSLDNSVPRLVEKRFPASCVPCEQYLRCPSYSEPAWTSTSTFYNPIANTLSSPVCHLSSNTGFNQGEKMSYKYSCNSITSELGQTERSRSGCDLHDAYFQSTPGHIRDPGRLHQNQVYSQNQSPSLVLHAIPKPVCNGCLHTSRIREATNNPGSLPIQSDTVQLLQYHSKCNSSLPQWLVNVQKRKETTEGTSYNEKQSTASVPSSMLCVNSSSVPSPDPLHAFTHVLAHPTYLQTASPSHRETLPSASLTDYTGRTMNERYNSVDLLERDIVKLPKNMSRNICAISKEKGNVHGSVDLESTESNCPSDRRTDTRKKPFQETKELYGKGLLKRHEGCTQGPSKKSDLFSTGQKLHEQKGVFHHEINSSSLAAKYVKNREVSENGFVDGKGAEIWILNNSSVNVAIAKDSRDRGNCSIKDKVDETFSNASLHSDVPNNCRENGGAFRKPKNNLLHSQFATSRIGLHGTSTKASLKLAEPVKLTGGAKHILKPPSQNGNTKQSFPIHYTLPFAETTPEGRERDLHGVNRYSGEQQSSPPGSKLLRWASSNSRLSQILSKEKADCPF